MALSKKPVIYQRGDRRGAEFKSVQSTLGFSDASAFSAHSAVKLEDMEISLKNSTVPAYTNIGYGGVNKMNDCLIEAILAPS